MFLCVNHVNEWLVAIKVRSIVLSRLARIEQLLCRKGWLYLPATISVKCYSVSRCSLLSLNVKNGHDCLPSIMV